MHIVKVAFESIAFDGRLKRGGAATLVWHLAQQYAATGHRVSLITPAHGHADYLVDRYGARELPYREAHAVPLVLDPKVWPDHPVELTLALSTRVFLLRRDGVDIYFLANEYLDLLPDRLYPDNETHGTDFAYFKPMVFQVDAVRLVERLLAGEPGVVHCHEPYHHYLLPAVLGGVPGRTLVSTVALNSPINEKVYRPQLERLLRMFSTTVDLDRFADPPPGDALDTAMANYLRPSYRQFDYGPDYTCYFSLVAAYTDIIDFLSPGQRQYYSTFRDAPSERGFERWTVSRIVKETAHKQFVGGCALPDWWLARDPSTVDRSRVLAERGLDARLPTFYHAARLDQNHKGQFELMRAVDRVLADDPGLNFVIRCAVGTGAVRASAAVPYFQEVADRYPGRVYLDWNMVDEEALFDEAAAADFCVFPSKFELDTFHIALGEAMACGTVPIITAQQTFTHYRCTLPLSDPAATGFAVPRSFRAKDERLVANLVTAIEHAVDIFRHDPATYRRLSRNAREVGRSFTWERCAGRRLERFRAGPPVGAGAEADAFAIDSGWFDRVSESGWTAQRARVAEAARERGDLDVYARCAVVDAASVRRLFDAAYRRADFERCAELAELAGPDSRALVAERCRVRAGGGGYRVTYRFPHADRVDLILDSVQGPDTGRGNRYTCPLARRPGGFEADLPPGFESRDLVFLLTLASGRIAWDMVPVRSHRVAGRRDRYPSGVGADDG
ncbi:MAG TPA: glycosyltransferase [Rugosimonospora sp.]|nr:glycosyltransferase [Rugosimonospora sp.]